jgi:hypothetical protein
MEQVLAVIMSEKTQYSKGINIYTKFHITNEESWSFASVIKNKTH